jgi:hypothetical protein
VKLNHSQSLEAINNEINYMIKYKVMIPQMYEDIPHQYRNNIIPSHMFIKTKYLPNGDFVKAKARLVAGGITSNR